MSKFLNNFKLLANDKRGVTALEYGMIAGLISVVLLATVGPLATRLGAAFTAIQF
jgi:pilus assembly protein Flp/PilA